MREADQIAVLFMFSCAYPLDEQDDIGFLGRKTEITIATGLSGQIVQWDGTRLNLASKDVHIACVLENLPNLQVLGDPRGQF